SRSRLARRLSAAAEREQAAWLVRGEGVDGPFGIDRLVGLRLTEADEVPAFVAPVKSEDGPDAGAFVDQRARHGAAAARLVVIFGFGLAKAGGELLRAARHRRRP